MAVSVPVSRSQPSRRRVFTRLVAFILLSVGTAAACPLELPVISVTVNDTVLSLEVAALPAARNCGLSKRDFLPPDSGMLFVLPETMPFAVWMKDTRLPLAIAFLDAAGRVLSIEQMAPLRTDVIYESRQPVRYAVEVNQGWFQAQGVHVGDVLDLALPAGLHVR